MFKAQLTFLTPTVDPIIKCFLVFILTCQSIGVIFSVLTPKAVSSVGIEGNKKIEPVLMGTIYGSHYI
jgi:hypothetical protein